MEELKKCSGEAPHLLETLAKVLVMAINKFDLHVLHLVWLPALEKLMSNLDEKLAAKGQDILKIMVLERVFRACMMHCGKIITTPIFDEKRASLLSAL